MKKLAYVSASIAVILMSAAWTGLVLYRQSAALPVAGLLHRSTVDPTVDRGGHTRGIVQVDLLRQIMTDRARTVPAEPESGHRVATQSHPLLDHLAPPFVLNDAWGKTWNLDEEVQGGPVVVVFYLGSTCVACMTHMTELDVAMSRFQKCGARVLTVSDDAPEFSRERTSRYGGFHFPLLSDHDHAVALAYGVWNAGPEGNADAAKELHGTFIIDREGVVRWVHVGDRPFADVDALLNELESWNDSK